MLLVLPEIDGGTEAAMVVEDPVGLLFEMTDVVWAVDAAAETFAIAADKFENG